MEEAKRLCLSFKRFGMSNTISVSSGKVDPAMCSAQSACGFQTLETQSSGVSAWQNCICWFAQASIGGPRLCGNRGHAWSRPCPYFLFEQIRCSFADI